MNSHWSHSLSLFGKSKFSNRWAWPLLGINEVQNKKIVGMWLVGQFNVNGHAQPTFIEELVSYKSFQSRHKKSRRSFILRSAPKLVNLAAQIYHWSS